jgi:hypothetical protein
MADVYLHIGLPKTGTTTVQTALERRSEALADAGVLYPAGRRAQRLAAFDLIGQRVEGDERHVPGAFARLVDEISGFDGKAIIFSEEELGLARPRQVRRLVQGLSDHRVFLVVTVRDMARTVVSAWQQSVVMGRTTTWQEYIAAVRDSGGDLSVTAGFWARHDLLAVMDTWGAVVPPERIRVVTVPPRGAPPGTLLERFAAATDLPPGIWGDWERTERYVSFGAAELEVVRRLNEQVVGPLTLRQHRFVVENGIRPGMTGTQSRPLTLPPEHAAWALEHGRGVVSELRRRETPVFGDLDDLAPVEAVSDGRRLDDVSEAELLAASEELLATLAQAYGRLARRYRQLSQADDGSPSAGDLLGSVSRRTTFRLKKLAQKHANDNRLFAAAARRYVKRGR